MVDFWSKVFDASIGGRSVTGETYNEGGYKVRTTQKSDYEGSVSGDSSSTLIMPPTAAGTSMEIEAESLEELESELISDGEFTQNEANEIVDKFRT